MYMNCKHVDWFSPMNCKYDDLLNMLIGFSINCKYGDLFLQ